MWDNALIKAFSGARRFSVEYLLASRSWVLSYSCTCTVGLYFLLKEAIRVISIPGQAWSSCDFLRACYQSKSDGCKSSLTSACCCNLQGPCRWESQSGLMTPGRYIQCCECFSSSTCLGHLQNAGNVFSRNLLSNVASRTWKSWQQKDLKKRWIKGKLQWEIRNNSSTISDVVMSSTVRSLSQKKLWQKPVLTVLPTVLALEDSTRFLRRLETDWKESTQHCGSLRIAWQNTVLWMRPVWLIGSWQIFCLQRQTPRIDQEIHTFEWAQHGNYTEINTFSDLLSSERPRLSKDKGSKSRQNGGLLIRDNPILERSRRQHLICDLCP